MAKDELTLDVGRKPPTLFQSTLPVFRLQRGERLIRLTCMRRDCPGDANGSKNFYVEALPDKPAAACVHCSKVSRFPNAPEA